MGQSDIWRALIAPLIIEASTRIRRIEPYAMPYETNKPIYVLRGLKMPMSRLWPQVKHFE